LKAIQEYKKRHYRYKYKYAIRPRIEEIEKIKHSLFGYELYDIKIRIGSKKIFYLKINEDFSFPSSIKISKEQIVCIARFIKDIGKFYIVKEKKINFDLIEFPFLEE
jgi:hypothetical protein